MAVRADLLGLQMQGGTLSPIPPNATRETQVKAINDVIAVLNNFNKDIAKSDTVTLPSDGSIQSVLTVPHNLGYKPRAFAYLNNVTLNISDTAYNDIDLPLPTYLSLGVTGTVIEFKIYIDLFVDETNLYLHVINAEGTPFSFPVKYFLTREASN